MFILLTFVGLGLSGYICWQLKVIGYQYDRVTRVSPLFYMESALALVIDITIFKVEFAGMQIGGLIIIICSFAVIILQAYLAE